MADLLRFKDILEMDGQENPLDRPKLSFNDLHVTQYRPGEDELINYRAMRRKKAYGAGTGEGGYVGEAVSPAQQAAIAISKKEKNKDVDEALTMQQRLKRARIFKRLQPRIKIAKEKAKRRIASKEKLQKRTMKKAREMLFNKLTKKIPKSELTFARRQEIEKRLEKPAMKKIIQRVARKLYPKVRKAEVEKKRKSK
jgi:hypothetical protein